MDAEREVDLLIAGAAPGRNTAALVASLEGLDVLLCEKSDQVGGTGSTSAGTLWILCVSCPFQKKFSLTSIIEVLKVEID